MLTNVSVHHNFIKGGKGAVILTLFGRIESTSRINTIALPSRLSSCHSRGYTLQCFSGSQMPAFYKRAIGHVSNAKLSLFRLAPPGFLPLLAQKKKTSECYPF